MTKQQVAERDEARAELREILKPGDVVYTSLLHVSRSGMLRVIAPFIMRNNEPRPLWASVGTALGLPLDRDRGGVKIGGCGMDMGFELVYQLSYALYPQGFGCIGSGCPANDHSNGDRDYTLGHVHPDGGYALRQRWL